MLNTIYLAILRWVTFSVVLGAEFTVSTCWVWFYKKTIKFEKFPTVSAESLNMSLFCCLFRALSAPGSICALLFSQVERSNMVVQLYRTSVVKTAQTKNWADLRSLYLRTQLCINRHLWFNILGSENTCTYTVPNRYWANPKTKQLSCSMTI